jgi:uroporphyrinogen decarboxylase
MKGTTLTNDLLLRVARGETVSRPPVWLMRQAGRFLTEYRAVRERAGSFINMIAQPEYAAEVTLQPVDLIGVDAAIIFSDILVIPEAMGLPYEMVEKKGPWFPKTLRDTQALGGIHLPDAQSNLDHTYEAIRLVKQELAGRVPLIGFAGAPWTIYCYMTEGQGSKTFSIAKALLYRDPAFAHQLLQMITDATILYLREQIKAGVDIVQVFDSWAGVLSEDLYAQVSLPYLRQICDAIQEVPVIIFAKGAFFALEALAGLDCQVIGLDWQTSPAFAQAKVQKQAFQGNMDPCALYAPPEEIQRMTLEMLQAFPPGRLIANLGHGIYPDLPRENVKTFVETVQSFSYSD